MLHRKKILHIAQATGGVKTYVEHILEYANPELYDFAVIAPENTFFREFCEQKSIPYYALDLHRGLNPFKNISAAFKIISILKKENPDIIHAHSAKGGFLGRIAARVAKKKVLYTPHAFSYLPFTGLSRAIFFLLEMISRKWTTALLAISYSEANRAIYELGYRKSQIKVILNAIPLNARPVLQNTGNNLKIRMIGRLTQQKNHLLFLEIANTLLKKYPETQFSILGAGIHDDLADEIYGFLQLHQLENKVTIEPWGDSLTSRKFLEDTDIFVMTSAFEGLPFSLLEAMSLGIPCVVSKVDGNTDVINNFENGFSCLSPEEFCTKIELLINNPQLRKTLGQKGYDYVAKKHSIQNTIHQIEELYDEVYAINAPQHQGAPLPQQQSYTTSHSA